MQLHSAVCLEAGRCEHPQQNTKTIQAQALLAPSILSKIFVSDVLPPSGLYAVDKLNMEMMTGCGRGSSRDDEEDKTGSGRKRNGSRRVDRWPTLFLGWFLKQRVVWGGLCSTRPLLRDGIVFTGSRSAAFSARAIPPGAFPLLTTC